MRMYVRCMYVCMMHTRRTRGSNFDAPYRQAHGLRQRLRGLPGPRQWRGEDARRGRLAHSDDAPIGQARRRRLLLGQPRRLRRAGAGVGLRGRRRWSNGIVGGGALWWFVAAGMVCC